MYTSRLSEKAMEEMKRLLLLSLFVSPAFAGGEDFHVPERPYECELLKPVDLNGWNQVPAEDRLRISELVYQRKAVMQKRQTLLCRDVSGGKVIDEFLSSQWWWKAKK